MAKLKMNKSEFNEILAEVIIEEGMYSDNPHEMKPVDTNVGPGDPENAPISDREQLALKAGAIKEGLEVFFKEFKIAKDAIQLQKGNKAVISDGSGNSYIVLFKVSSWNPAAIEVQEMKIVNIDSFEEPVAL
jgi:hypothetical protein